MSRENFDASLTLVLKHEGGYSNHPRDPGGATMKGVIQRVYDGYRRSHGLIPRSVRMLGDAELRDIYRALYWDKICGDDLPGGIDYVVFDGAVNSGPAQSAKWLQRALGVNDDGVIGPLTLDRSDDVPAAHLVDAICDKRMGFLRALRTWSVFGTGWSRRVADVRVAGKRMAGGVTTPRPSKPPLPVPAPQSQGSPLVAFAVLIILAIIGVIKWLI
ncbi:MAG: glycoside hydrolase family 108 protein [Candidatus Paceibacterota bacterium]